MTISIRGTHQKKGGNEYEIGVETKATCRGDIQDMLSRSVQEQLPKNYHF